MAWGSGNVTLHEVIESFIQIISVKSNANVENDSESDFAHKAHPIALIVCVRDAANLFLDSMGQSHACLFSPSQEYHRELSTKIILGQLQNCKTWSIPLTSRDSLLFTAISGAMSPFLRWSHSQRFLMQWVKEIHSESDWMPII